jgi:hypothetical protein
MLGKFGLNDAVVERARFVAQAIPIAHPSTNQSKALRLSPAMAGGDSMISYAKLDRNFRNLDWHYIAEKSQCQPKSSIAIRIVDSVTFAFIGAVGGVFLSAVGSLFSSTPVGVAAAIVLGIAIGGYAGGVTSGIVGGIYGVLVAGFGSLISGTELGVVITILTCAALAAGCTWTRRDIALARTPHRDSKRVDGRQTEVCGRKLTEIRS